MSEQEKTLFLEMARRLANLEKALNSILLERRRVMIMEVGAIEQHLELKRTLVPKHEQNQA
jgi:hypothetical protein